MLYQWGHKDPFTFATNSELWGDNVKYNGKYPVKIYTIDGVLIYQDDIGTTNKDKQPAGGLILSSTDATSMMEAIKNPTTFYSYSGTVINQVGHTKDLWNYYWTSYSRGSDGNANNNNWHNSYLEGYITQRLKSIYDPCPFGFRIPTNGTYNQFTPKLGWVAGSYDKGIILEKGTTSWYSCLGWRTLDGKFEHIGGMLFYSFSTTANTNQAYAFISDNNRIFYVTRFEYKVFTLSVRCIELMLSVL